jgi:hypothetical protein
MRWYLLNGPLVGGDGLDSVEQNGSLLDTFKVGRVVGGVASSPVGSWDVLVDGGLSSNVESKGKDKDEGFHNDEKKRNIFNKDLMTSRGL